MARDRLQAVAAEALGTAMLLMVVVGSGIMGERLAQGNLALALLANAGATALGLYCLIEVLGPISGAHFNPAVSLVMAARGILPRGRLLPYALAQFVGAVAGVWLAHLMFELPIIELARKSRGGVGQWAAEGIATTGLVLVILLAPPRRAAALVACYIGAAYWFTSSTSFANPAATFGRMWTDTFAGIAPSSVWGFVLAQGLGSAVGAWLAARLVPTPEPAP